MYLVCIAVTTPISFFIFDPALLLMDAQMKATNALQA
jgi:hypothetical protein